MSCSKLQLRTAVMVAFAVAGLVATTASARTSAVPSATAQPTLQGQAAQPFVGDRLTVSNGSWSGSPTKFSYQWDRCDPTGDRQNCVPIAGATAQSYTAATADINHTLHANVFATNADGTGKADTKGSGVVAARGTPKNTARPTISGQPVVGDTLTVNNGTWTGASTFSYQWLQCDANGNNCVEIAGATGKTYGVRSTDVGHELLAQVKAANRLGSTTAESDRTVPATVTVQTTTTVVTVPGDQAPTISFLSLKRVSFKLYARFRVCDDSETRLTVIARDNKARALSYTRRFSVMPLSCGTFARNWLLIKRFRSPGRLVVTLRAADQGGHLSRLVSRSVTIR
jgi:signal peptidase I